MNNDFITVVAMDVPTGKEYSVDGEGGIVKTPAANNAKGWGYTCHAPDIHAFKTILDEVSQHNNRAIILGYISGTEDGKPYRLVSNADLIELGGDEKIDKPIEVDGYLYAARVKRMFRHSSWMGFDRDLVEGMPVELKGDAPFNYWWNEQMCDFLPMLKDVSYLRVGSASSRIHLNGESIAPNNTHVYIKAKIARDTERFGASALIHSFFTGYGFQKKVSNGGVNGKELTRKWSIFDPTTFSRERLYFDGSPIVKDETGVVSLSSCDIEAVEGGLDCVDTERLLMPTKEQQKESGIELNITKGGSVSTVDIHSLTPNVEFIVKLPSGGEQLMTMQQFVNGEVNRYRCQTPFRPDSNSWAAYVSKDDCAPFMYDVGTQTKYEYNVVNALFAELARQYKETGAAKADDTVDLTVESVTSEVVPVPPPPMELEISPLQQTLINNMIVAVEASFKGASDFIDKQAVCRATTQVFVSQKNDKVMCINGSGHLVQFTSVKYRDGIQEYLYGELIRKTELRKYIEAYSVPVSEADVNVPPAIVMEGDAESINKKVKAVATIAYKEYEKHISVWYQRGTIKYSTDMFATQSKLLIEEDYAHLVSEHKSFKNGVYNPEIIADYKDHYPALDVFIKLVVAARFASNRKKAYVWMQATSDWGKGFIGNIFKQLGLMVEMSTAEIEHALEGKPMGKEPKDFKNAWILWVDEFKAVKSEIKLLDSSINGSPKNQMNFEAELFMKLFTSAEGVDSLAGSIGVEPQFANRFSFIPNADVSLEDRPLFKRSRSEYFKSVKAYVGSKLNVLVEEYRAMGKGGARDCGDKVLDEYNKEHRLSNHFGSLLDSVEEIASDMKKQIVKHRKHIFIEKYNKNWIVNYLEANSEVVNYHGTDYLLLKYVDKFIGDYIKNNIHQSEQIKISHKKRDIKRLIDDSERVDTNTKVRVYDANGENAPRRGILVCI